MPRQIRARKKTVLPKMWRLGMCVGCGVYLKAKQRYFGKVLGRAMCRKCSRQEVCSNKKINNHRPETTKQAKFRSFLCGRRMKTQRRGSSRFEEYSRNDDSECSTESANPNVLTLYFLDGARTTVKLTDGCTVHEVSETLYPGWNVGLYEVEVEIGESSNYQLLPPTMTIDSMFRRWARLGWDEGKVIVPMYTKSGPPRPHSPFDTSSEESEILTVMSQIKQLTQFEHIEYIRFPSPPALMCMDTSTTPHYVQQPGSSIRDTLYSTALDMSLITQLYSYSDGNSDCESLPTGPTTATHASTKQRNNMRESCASYSLEWCNTVATNTDIDIRATKSQGMMVDTVMTGPRMCTASTNTESSEFRHSYNTSRSESPSRLYRNTAMHTHTSIRLCSDMGTSTDTVADTLNYTSTLTQPHPVRDWNCFALSNSTDTSTSCYSEYTTAISYIQGTFVDFVTDTTTGIFATSSSSADVNTHTVQFSSVRVKSPSVDCTDWKANAATGHRDHDSVDTEVDVAPEWSTNCAATCMTTGTALSQNNSERSAAATSDTNSLITIAHTKATSAAEGDTNTRNKITVSYNKNIVNFTTTWTMPQEDVNLITKAKQWLSFALQVNGTAHPVTWLHRPAWQVTELSVSDTFGAFVCTPCDLSDGVVLQPLCMSTFTIKLGVCYKWTGTNLVVDTLGSCAADSVQLSNHSNQAWVFGLTKLDPKTKTMQPICADMVLQRQPVVYTPVLTMYAKVGRSYKTSSIVSNINTWTKFDIARVNSTYQYDRDTSAWVAAL